MFPSFHSAYVNVVAKSARSNLFFWIRGSLSACLSRRTWKMYQILWAPSCEIVACVVAGRNLFQKFSLRRSVAKVEFELELKSSMCSLLSRWNSLPQWQRTHVSRVKWVCMLAWGMNAVSMKSMPKNDFFVMKLSKYSQISHLFRMILPLSTKTHCYCLSASFSRLPDRFCMLLYAFEWKRKKIENIDLITKTQNLTCNTPYITDFVCVYDTCQRTVFPSLISHEIFTKSHVFGWSHVFLFLKIIFYAQ